MMAPAALWILTTTFRDGADRHTALGAWGAISGLAAAAGVFFAAGRLRHARGAARHRRMLVLVYALIEAADVGWGATRTIALLGAAGLALAGFGLVEQWG